jgi:hypothetical protein
MFASLHPHSGNGTPNREESGMVHVEGARGGRFAALVAIAGTVVIGCGAFWLSFTALTDLARRSGVNPGQAWVWPLILDGLIVASTVAVVAVGGAGSAGGSRSARYPWVLLSCGAVVSVCANALHALIGADLGVPRALAASVAAVPPLVLVAVTHLTVVLTRPTGNVAPARLDPAAVLVTETAAFVSPANPPPGEPRVCEPAPTVVVEPMHSRVEPTGRELAAVLHTAGWSNAAIAEHIGVHRATIGRWLAVAPSTVPETTGTPTGNPTGKVSLS